MPPSETRVRMLTEDFRVLFIACLHRFINGGTFLKEHAEMQEWVDLCNREYAPDAPGDAQ